MLSLLLIVTMLWLLKVFSALELHILKSLKSLNHLNLEATGVTWNFCISSKHVHNLWTTKESLKPCIIYHSNWILCWSVFNRAPTPEHDYISSYWAFRMINCWQIKGLKCLNLAKIHCWNEEKNLNKWLQYYDRI